jgi:hypothetical protein
VQLHILAVVFMDKGIQATTRNFCWIIRVTPDHRLPGQSVPSGRPGISLQEPQATFLRILNPIVRDIEMGLAKVAFDRESLTLLTTRILSQLERTLPKSPKGLVTRASFRQLEICPAVPVEERWFIMGDKPQPDDSISTQAKPIRPTDLISVPDDEFFTATG